MMDNEVVALIAYMRNNEIDEVAWTFSDVQQARDYFEDNIKTPEDFYEAPKLDEEQAMSLFILEKKATLTWTVDKKLSIQTSTGSAKND